MFGPLASQLGPLGRASSRQSYVEKVKALTPIAYWPLKETSGTTAFDVSGNGLHGVISTSPAPLYGQPGIGDGGTSLGFNANGQTVDTYAARFVHVAAQATTGSIALWVASSSSGAAEVFRFRTNTNTYLTGRRTATTYEFYPVIAGALPGGSIRSLATVSAAWYFFVYSWLIAGTSLTNTLYVNGVQSSTYTTTAGTPSSAIMMNDMGMPKSAASFLVGSLAHVAYFNRALSAAEIADLAVV